MGAACIRPHYIFVSNDQVPGQGADAIAAFEKLQLKESHVDIFYTAFVDMDSNFCGFVRMDELKDYFGVSSAAVNDHILNIFESNEKGHINFMEFVCIMWNFLSRDKSTFPSYAFSMFCDTEKRTLTSDQLDRLIAAIHGEGYKKKKGSGLLQILEEKKKSMKKSSPPKPISIDDFNILVRSHPVIIGPMLKLRYHLCNTIIGEDFWLEMTKTRMESKDMSDNNYALKITGKTISAKLVLEDAIMKSFSAKTSRKKSMVDTMKDALRNKKEVSPMEAPSLIIPTTKRKRKSVFKPDLTLVGADEAAGLHRVAYFAKSYENQVYSK